MAGKNRGNDGGTGQTNTFRFVMIEGTLSESTMGAFAQAITTALKSATPPGSAPRVQGRAAPALGSGTVPAPDSSEPEGEEIAVVEPDDDQEADSPPKPKSSTGPRKYPQAKVMTDVDLESDVSFPDFAASKKPNTLQDRYLIAAAWYKLHRSMDAITMHHIYTCFLHPKVKWPTSAMDFDQPLRQLVKAKRLGRGDRGYYVINNIGLADVVALGGE